MPNLIANVKFRAALIALNGLKKNSSHLLPQPQAKSGPEWVSEMVGMLSFVQVDSVSAVERAQHQILFSRNRRYVADDLDKAVAEKRSLFESFTHDAAILPMAFYPYWKHYFERTRKQTIHAGYSRYFAPVKPVDKRNVMKQITERGPLKPKDIGNKKVNFRDDRVAPPTLAKVTMEYLWRTGELAVSYREGRQKVYDLSERVIPEAYLLAEVSVDDYVDFVCREALKRLGAGTPVQIARFYEAVSLPEASRWCDDHLDHDVIAVQAGLADKKGSPASLFALTPMLDFLADPGEPPGRLRLLSPFDPLIRDRERTSRVFGFDYTLEMFVPPSKRVYGYYVLPILEGDRFTGRLDAKLDRKEDQLNVLGLWWEKGVKPTRQRRDQLDRELKRLAKYLGVSRWGAQP